MLKPRPYQQDAIDFTMAHIEKSLASAGIILPTGAGKSIVVAELARRINQASGKSVLCLAPSSELVTQNHKKYESYGLKASIYSASAGGKSLRYPVVFGSPKTVANNLNKFGDFAAIIIDEAQGITPTVQAIISALREKNPLVRIIWLTATPYRTGTGYIYKSHYLNGPTDDTNAYKPYFDHVVYELHAQQLISWGFLNPPVIGEVTEIYDTSGMTLNSMGQYDQEQMSQVFEGWGRKTANIVADIVQKSWNRRSVLMFAATREHAEEVMASLPPGEYQSVFSSTPKKERAKILADFVAGKFKYLVNQRILQVGFDAPRCDVVAILTATESPGLLQQIIGRGTRLCDEPYPDGRLKKDFLLLDYGGNIERHFGETGDVFTPEIVARKPPEGVPMNVPCPACQFTNVFSMRPNPEELIIAPEGHYVDRKGRPLTQEVLKAVRDPEGKFTGDFIYQDVPIPAHYGRRCTNMVMVGRTREMERCSHLYDGKDCPSCGEPNDIAARFCTHCKAELVNPNEKLALEAAKLEADPHAVKQSRVIKLYFTRFISDTSGEEGLLVTFKTDSEKKAFQSVEVRYYPDHKWESMQMRWNEFCRHAFGKVLDIKTAVTNRDFAKLPHSIRYQRKKGARFVEMKQLIWSNDNE